LNCFSSSLSTNFNFAEWFNKWSPKSGRPSSSTPSKRYGWLHIFQSYMRIFLKWFAEFPCSIADLVNSSQYNFFCNVVN